MVFETFVYLDTCLRKHATWPRLGFNAATAQVKMLDKCLPVRRFAWTRALLLPRSGSQRGLGGVAEPVFTRQRRGLAAL